MSKMNNKGFLLTESLIVSTFVLTVLVFIFIQFKNLMVNYKSSYMYNNVEDIYSLGSMGAFLKNNITISIPENSSYLEIYKDGTCTNIPEEKVYSCNELADAMNLEYMIYIDSDIESLKSSIGNTSLNQEIKDFIERASGDRIVGKGRLIAKFKNGNFATVAVDEKRESIEPITIPTIRSWSQNSNDDFHKEEIRTKINKIEFVDLKNVNAPTPDNTSSWDVSSNKDNSIIAWQADDDKTLYIGGSGGIVANENSADMFENFTNLKQINFGNIFDTSAVTNMSGMFYGCTSLNTLDLTNFNTSKVTNMSSMFQGCTSLNTLDLSSFDTSQVTNMQSMFRDNSSLKTIYVSVNFVTTAVTNGNYMFTNDTNLVGENRTTFNSSNTDKEYARIDKPGQSGYFTQK